MYQIDETRMLHSARISLPANKPTPSIFKEGMIFLLVALICSFMQSSVAALYSTFAMITDPAYYELILSDDFGFESMTEYIFAFVNDTPRG